MASTTGPETSMRYMQIARQWFTEGWRGDLAMADDIFSEELRTNGVRVGVAGPVGRISDRLTGFPDLTTTIEDMFVSGDKLAVTLIWRGTSEMLIVFLLGRIASRSPVHATITLGKSR